MNDTMDIENLNLSISNILSAYQSEKCSLSEQEVRELQDELVEFVPIEDELEDVDDDNISESNQDDNSEESNDDNDDDEEEQSENEENSQDEEQMNPEISDMNDQNKNNCNKVGYYNEKQNKKQMLSDDQDELFENDILNQNNYGYSCEDFSLNCRGLEIDNDKDSNKQICLISQNINKNNIINNSTSLFCSSIDSIDEFNGIYNNSPLISTHIPNLSTNSLNSPSSNMIKTSSSIVSKDALKKKKKINKSSKNSSFDKKGYNQTNQRKVQVSYVDIYKRKTTNQKCRMKLKVPYNLQSNLESYFLLGDIVIEMNFSSINNSDYQNCILNMYKPVERVVYNKKTRCLSMFQASNNQFLVDFNFLSKQLIEYPDQNIHLVGRLIEKYQEIVKLLHLQIKNVSTLSGFTPQLIAQRREFFDEQVNTFLEKIDEHQMFFIQKFHTNYQNASFEAYEVGYSRQFLALLGTDEQTITNIILRSGKPELYNFESRLKMMLVRMLSIVQGKFKGAQSDFEIYTFDNIRVYAKLKILPVCIEYPPHLKLPLDNYNEINCMAFGLIDVDPTMIQQVIELRKQDKYHSHLKSIVQELNYTKQSELFLQKYYEKAKSKYIQDRQSLKNRKQITKDNEQILMNHQLKQIEYNNENNNNNNNTAHQSNESEQKQQQNKNTENNNSNLFQSDVLGQSIHLENSNFKYISQNSNKVCPDSPINSSQQYQSNIESDLIKYNHFDYIDESYIAQDVQLSKDEEGQVSLVEQYSQPCYNSNTPLNSSFISPATNFKTVFAKSHRIIQLADQLNSSQGQNLHFEFNLSV